MKRKFMMYAVAVLTFSLLLSACGGGGGGGSSSGGPLATGLFTSNTSTVANTFSGLLGTEAYAHWQNLYLANAVNGSGKITGMAIQYFAAMSNTVTCPDTTIKLGPTVLSAVTGTFADNVNNGAGGQTTVLANSTLTFPAGAAGTWHTITFTTPFEYDGGDNLVVEFERTGACSGAGVTDGVSSPVGYNATVWTYSAGATGGNSGTFVQNAQFTFAGGDDLVWNGNSSSNAYPFFGGLSNHTQLLYPAASINGSGPVTGIGMVVGDSLTSGGTYTVTIKLGHSALTDLTTTFTDNFSGTPVTVANNLAFTVPAGVPQGSTLWLPVDGTFDYNGTDNLLVDIAVTAASANNTGWLEGAAGAHAVSLLANSPDAAAGITSNAPYTTKFRFNGSTMDVDVMPGAANSGSSQVLGNGTAGRVESLYLPVYLGTGGTINSVSVRLNSAPSAATLSNFKIYMGHTTDTQFALTDTYAGSMIGDGTLVYSGTLNVPGTLQAGDWLTIPLQTPFAYDPTKSLAIYFGTDQAGAATAPVANLASGGQFPNYMMGAWSNGPYTDNPGWTWPGIVQVRLGIAK